MVNATVNAEFLAVIDAQAKAVILGSIAQHYGITADEAFAEVILDAIVSHDLGADHLLHFGAFVGPMQAGGIEDDDFFPRDALFFEDFEDRRQDELVGDGPGNVTDDDARRLFAASEFGQGRRADRTGEAPGNRLLRVG